MKDRMSSGMRFGLVLIAAVLAAVTWSSVAMALKSARQATTIDPGSFGSVGAKCPSHTTAVSGGFAAPGFDPTQDGPIVGRIGSRRVGDRQIVARALNFGSQPGELRSFAYCARNGHGLHVRSATTRIEANTRGSAVARCPRGQLAVAGGFGTDRVDLQVGPQVLTLTSKRLGDRRWKVVGLNINAGARAGKLIAYAYCAEVPFELITRSKEVAPAPGSVRTFDVSCPSGTQVFSGGFDGQVELVGDTPHGTAAVTSRRASGARAWRTSTLSVFGPNPASATAYVYCKR